MAPSCEFKVKMRGGGVVFYGGVNDVSIGDDIFSLIEIIRFVNSDFICFGKISDGCFCGTIFGTTDDIYISLLIFRIADSTRMERLLKQIAQMVLNLC